MTATNVDPKLGAADRVGLANPIPLILIVDDEPSICWALERSFRSAGYDALIASSAEEGLQIARESKPQLVFLDVRLPKRDGISALPDFIAATEGAPIVVMTAFGELETAVAAVQHGASDYLTKPFKLDEAMLLAKRNIDETLSHPGHEQPARGNMARANMAIEKRIVGTSPAIQYAFRQIALVAGSELSVLITGETGTGKELVAEAIHRHSPRAAQPYLPVAPVALNEDLVESELFGHVRGAFTGASQDRAGLFEQADGGTVLLDEIGELPLGLQAKLLRVLEQGEYCRVGEVLPRRCNVRVLAATNCDLNQAVAEGRFREDLYWRLNGMHIHLPPLRERTEDLGPLCSYFLTYLGRGQVAELDAEVLEQLTQRAWYGNVRELKNAIGHAALMAGKRPLEIRDFPAAHARPTVEGRVASLSDAVAAWARNRASSAVATTTSLHAEFLAAAEPALFIFALEHTAGNRLKAADLLGLHRGTLREKIRLYGLED